MSFSLLSILILDSCLSFLTLNLFLWIWAVSIPRCWWIMYQSALSMQVCVWENFGNYEWKLSLTVTGKIVTWNLDKEWTSVTCPSGVKEDPNIPSPYLHMLLYILKCIFEMASLWLSSWPGTIYIDHATLKFMCFCLWSGEVEGIPTMPKCVVT